MGRKTSVLSFVLSVSIAAFIALPTPLWADFVDTTDSNGISYDKNGNLTNDFSDRNKYNIPVTVPQPFYTQPQINTTGGGNYGGRVQDGTPFRGNYYWEPQNETAARIDKNAVPTHQLQGTPFRGNYNWSDGQSARTPAGPVNITHPLEGTPFRGNYNWSDGQSARTPAGSVNITHPLQGTPFRGNYPW